MTSTAAPPKTRSELVLRAVALEGESVAELARRLGAPVPGGGRSTKGRVGELLERALGATGAGGGAVLDFPDIGVELKTIPTDGSLAPYESTFVCAVRLDEDVDFDASWVAEKLGCVLFVPIVGARTTVLADRVLGPALLWEPSTSDRAQLRADYDDIMGLVGMGRIEEVSARLGRFLQLRPKARDGSARTLAFGREGERIATVPRGFYLRATFTGGLLARREQPAR